MWNFQEVFLIILTLFANLKLMSVLFIHETFLVYKLETFTSTSHYDYDYCYNLHFVILWDI